MHTNWKKLGVFLASIGSLYIILVSIITDFAQLFSIKYGGRLLILLFLTALGYKSWEQVRKIWQNYDRIKAQLLDVRNFILRSSGASSGNILLCARTLWLFKETEHILVSELNDNGLVIIDVSKIPLEPGNLLGMHFRLMSSDKECARGTVQSCAPTHACIQLYEHFSHPVVGDLAIPLVPPNATDLERLLGNILFIISE